MTEGNEIYYENDYYIVFKDGVLIQAEKPENFTAIGHQKAVEQRNALNKAIMAQIEVL